jgi:hypothetical protein
LTSSTPPDSRAAPAAIPRSTARAPGVRTPSSPAIHNSQPPLIILRYYLVAGVGQGRPIQLSLPRTFLSFYGFISFLSVALIVYMIALFLPKWPNSLNGIPRSHASFARDKPTRNPHMVIISKGICRVSCARLSRLPSAEIVASSHRYVSHCWSKG